MYACPIDPAARRTPPLPPARTCNGSPARALERSLLRHPVLALAGALLLTGAGMVAAVSLVTALFVLPLSLLLGWV